MVEIFRTNVENKIDAEIVIKYLKINLPHTIINFDLEDCDRILRVENIIINEVYEVQLLVKKLGFICSHI